MFSTKRKTSLYEKGVYPASFTEDFKESIRARDKHRCAICGHRKKPKEQELDVHHINFKKNTRRDNCISLCRRCHTVVHKYYDNHWRYWWWDRLSGLARCREGNIKLDTGQKRQIVHEMREMIKEER